MYFSSTFAVNTIGKREIQRVEKLHHFFIVIKGTYCFVVPNDFDVIVMVSQTIGSLHERFVTCVCPPLSHVAQFVVKSATVVIIMR